MVSTPRRLLARLARGRAELERGRGQTDLAGERGEHLAQARPSAPSMGGPAATPRSTAYPHAQVPRGGAPLVGVPRAHGSGPRISVEIDTTALSRGLGELAGAFSYLGPLAGEQSERVRDGAAAQAGLTVGDWPGPLDLERDLDLGGGVDHAR